MKRNITIGKFNISITDFVLFIFLFMEFAFVAYCNLSRIPNTLDNDAAKVFTHAVEMWNSKTIFIPNWLNETMLELDTALLFAVPIYAVTNDIIISFGISNIIVLLLFYFFIVSILKKMGQPFSTGIISCILLTIPYSFGQLLYLNMMFFSGSFYGIKILLPFMLIWILITTPCKHNICYYLVIAVSAVFTLLFSISSGPYSLLCVIAPIAVFYLWNEIGKMKKFGDIFSKWLISRNNLVLYIHSIAAIVGISISILANIDPSGASKGVVEYGDFTDNLMWIIDGFVELLGASPYEPIDILSLAGITALSHYAVAIIAMICFVIISIFGIKIFFVGSQNTNICRYTGFGYLYLLFIWNLFVIIISPISFHCRYELMSVIPAIPLCVIMIRNGISKILGTVQQIVCKSALALLIVVVAITSDCRILRDDCRPEMASNNKKYEHVLDIIHGLPEDQVFFLDDEGRAEVLRALDYKSGKEYFAYTFYNNSVMVHDYYLSHIDASHFDDNHLLVVDEYVADFDQLPPYLSSLYTEVDSYQGVTIYRASKNRMDGVSGYKYNSHSIDYFYSPEYTINTGIISDEDGSLMVSGDGNVAVTSPWFNNTAGELSIKLNYSCIDAANSNVIGTITLLDPEIGNVLAENEISSTENSVELTGIDVSSSCNVVMQITINDGVTACLSNIEYNVCDGDCLSSCQ